MIHATSSAGSSGEAEAGSALPRSSSSVQTSGTANGGRVGLSCADSSTQEPKFVFGPAPEASSHDGQTCSLSPGQVQGSADDCYQSEVSLVAWPRIVLRNVFKTRTPFSLFVRKAICHCKGVDADPPSSALFPIPLPHDDVWNVAPSNCNKPGRLRLAYRKMLHLCILGLNYVHFESPLGIVHLLGRCPNKLHLAVYERVLAFIKAGGPSSDISISSCGRKSHQLDARIKELEKVLQSLNLAGRAHYGADVSKKEVKPDNSKDELRPYRELDASRLKLSGRANWDPGEFLSDLFFMPYVEPRCNQFDVVPPKEVLPDLSRVKKSEVLKLCKVWDQQGLLRLYPAEHGPRHEWGLSKIFNNFKNSSVDRQIGDRRGMNFAEGRIVGPSKTLPSCTTLLQLCPLRYVEMLAVAIADRRDFYHQFRVSDERACSNALFPILSAKEVREFRAYDGLLEFVKDLSAKKERTSGGDHLQGKPKPILFEDSSEVIASFGALYQGDHLGVEFATDSHAALMKSGSLLDESSRLQGGKFILHDDVTSGLIIDDFFVISREPLSRCDRLADSAAVQRLKVAKELYSQQGLIGSDDKDVLGDVRFKVCGAEIFRLGIAFKGGLWLQVLLLKSGSLWGF